MGMHGGHTVVGVCGVIGLMTDCWHAMCEGGCSTVGSCSVQASCSSAAGSVSKLSCTAFCPASKCRKVHATIVWAVLQPTVDQEIRQAGTPPPLTYGTDSKHFQLPMAKALTLGRTARLPFSIANPLAAVHWCSNAKATLATPANEGDYGLATQEVQERKEALSKRDKHDFQQEMQKVGEHDVRSPCICELDVTMASWQGWEMLEGLVLAVCIALQTLFSSFLP